MARIAEHLLLLLLDNPSAQPQLDRSRLGRGAALRTCAEALGAARACAEADAAGAADDDNAGQLAPGPAAEGGDGVVLDDDGGLGQNLEPLLGLHGLGVSVQKDGI